MTIGWFGEYLLKIEEERFNCVSFVVDFHRSTPLLNVSSRVSVRIRPSPLPNDDLVFSV